MTMNTSITSAPATPEQLKQFDRMLDDILAHAKNVVIAQVKPETLGKPNIQRILENGNEIKAAVAETAVARIQESAITDRYKDEERRSTYYAYPPEYKGPKPIEEQIKTLAAILDLDPTSALEYAKQLPTLPQGAEGWFAVPSADALAKKHFSDVKEDDRKHVRAILHVFDCIAKRRPFHNWRAEQMTPERVRITARTKEALEQITQVQKGDILIIAAQLGQRHRGRPTRRARECFVANEFGLGWLIGGAIALTHPERFVRFEELDMDLPGDEFDDPVARDRFVHAPYLFFRDGKLGAGAGRCGFAYEYDGSVSGFLPQAA
jgi:hypothetical protein